MPPKSFFNIEKIIIKIRNKMKKEIISPITTDNRYKYESYTVIRLSNEDKKGRFSVSHDLKKDGRVRFDIYNFKFSIVEGNILVSGGKFI